MDRKYLWGLALLAVLVLAPLAVWGYGAMGGRSQEKLIETPVNRLMANQERFRYKTYRARLLHKFDIDFHAYAVSGSKDLDGYADVRFEALRAKMRNRYVHSMLLLIDTFNKVVVAKTSASLAEIYPRNFILYLQNRQMVPFFKSGYVGRGALETTDLLLRRAREARLEAALLHGEDGLTDGSKRVGAGWLVRRTSMGARGGNSPGSALGAYLDTVSKDVRDTARAFETKDVRGAVFGALRTDKTKFKRLKTAPRKKCGDQQSRIDIARGIAVIRYAIHKRLCQPYLFRRVRGKWILDFAAINNSIATSSSRGWYFPHGVPADYGFAFVDWRFTENGFPVM